MSHAPTHLDTDSQARAKSGQFDQKSGAFFAEDDQRVHLPVRTHLSRPDSAPSVMDRLRSGLKGAQEQWQNIDRQELQHKGERLLRQYPWQSALVGFTAAALLGRKIFQR